MRDALIDSAVQRSRTTVLLMLTLLVFGVIARVSIPIESDPRIEVPFFVITVVHEGISPEDCKRLLVLPIEQSLNNVEGIKEVTSYASEGAATVMVEFDVEEDLDQALLDVREAVDRAKIEFPSTAEEPFINEQSTADFPVLQVNLVGHDVAERVLQKFARDLAEEVETIPNVLEAAVRGERDDLLEVIIDPAALSAYSISVESIVSTMMRNSRMIAAGGLTASEGNIAVKIPSVVEDPRDLFELPVRVSGDAVVTLSDVALIRRAFKDRTSHSRVNGSPSVTLNIVKRANANIIDITAAVKAVVEAWRVNLPKSIQLFYTQEQAPWAEQQVLELQGNIVTALVLVMVLVVAAMGLRGGLLVGGSIPVSFLFALILIWLLGYSFNFMVMFGMLLGLGMLIDGAIVIIEYADRKLIEGHPKKEAFAIAAKRMFWPVTASVSTTLVAFSPLMFWPGVSGKFMSYLPVTVFAVLAGSLLYALVFGPALGGIFGKASTQSERTRKRLEIMETGNPVELRGFTGIYARIVRWTSRYAALTVLLTVLVLGASFWGYSQTNLGMIFFNQSHSIYGQLSIRARGNLDIDQSHALVQEMEDAILGIDGIKEVNTWVFKSSGGGFMGRGSQASDRIGSIFFTLYEETERRLSGTEIFEQIRAKTADFAGVVIELRAMEQGPPVGKPIQIEFAAIDDAFLRPVVNQVKAYLSTSVVGLRDIEDTLPIPGVQWEISVDRAQAAIYGADVALVGAAVQLVTNGVWVGEYRPNDTDDAVDIRVRFPPDQRGLQVLDDLRVTTNNGLVPISNFVTRHASAKVDTITRRDRKDIRSIQANVAPGVLSDTKVKEIQAWLDNQALDPRVDIRFRGANEEQAESMAFISQAFFFALCLMFVLLVTQFNSLYQAFLILCAVVMSTAGVLLGLIITQEPFSAILTGVGVVALAGIVVNNNIVLIDTYNHIHKAHPELDHVSVIVRTGVQRLRPVLLTTVTTITGLLPLASHLSIDFVNNRIVFGGMLSAFWVPLAQAIVFGLTFASLLTLLSTPAMLALPFQIKQASNFVAKRFRGLVSKPVTATG